MRDEKLDEGVILLHLDVKTRIKERISLERMSRKRSWRRSRTHVLSNPMEEGRVERRVGRPGVVRIVSGSRGVLQLEDWTSFSSHIKSGEGRDVGEEGLEREGGGDQSSSTVLKRVEREKSSSPWLRRSQSSLSQSRKS